MMGPKYLTMIMLATLLGCGAAAKAEDALTQEELDQMGKDYVPSTEWENEESHKPLYKVPKVESEHSWERVTPIDKAPEEQARRKQLIEKMIERGVFTEVLTSEDGEDPGHARIFVTEKFFLLSDAARLFSVKTVYAYAFDAENDSNIIYLRDVHTGRSVGFYSLKAGGMDLHAPRCWPYC